MLMGNPASQVIKVDPVHPDESALVPATRAIRSGGVVVFPTETVYGIGASALDSEACARIFKIKGRPSDNPLIVHASSFDEASRYGMIPKEYREALLRIWPSPITVIVESTGRLPNEVTAGLDTVAIRVPAHPVALSLIAGSGVPIAAPSANPSKKPSATTGLQAARYFKGTVEAIIDAGPSFFGVESTIIDLRDFTILRPGPFTTEEIERAFGKKPNITGVTKGLESPESAVSPGVKYKHYAPDTPAFLFEGSMDALLDAVAELTTISEFAFIGSSEDCEAASREIGCSTISLGPAGELYEVAKNLYNAFILLDSMKVNFAIVREFPEDGIGLAIMNRIRKATSHLKFSTSQQLEALVSTLRK